MSVIPFVSGISQRVSAWRAARRAAAPAPATGSGKVLVDVHILKSLAGIKADKDMSEEELLKEAADEFLRGQIRFDDLISLSPGMQNYAKENGFTTLREMHKGLARIRIDRGWKMQEKEDDLQDALKRGDTQGESYNTLKASHNAMERRLNEQVERLEKENAKMAAREKGLTKAFTAALDEKDIQLGEVVEVLTAFQTVYQFDDEASAKKFSQMNGVIRDLTKQLKSLQQQTKDDIAQIKEDAKAEIVIERKAADQVRKDAMSGIVDALKAIAASAKGGGNNNNQRGGNQTRGGGNTTPAATTPTPAAPATTAPQPAGT